MKKILIIKIAIISIVIISFLTIIIGVISAFTGASIGYNVAYNESANINSSSAVINNHLYATRYRMILNKFLIDKGYVSLERLVFYLQRKNNILDITTLSNKEWESAYLKNLNKDLKRMIPIKTICKELEEDKTIPEYTVTSDTNSNGIFINALNLCFINNTDIIKSNDYTESYSYLPYIFPLKNTFTTTSIVFENRNLDLNLSNEELAKTNYHSGWDFAVPIGTNIYSICSGKVKSVMNTQFNDLPFDLSKNSTGNYIEIDCDNGLTAQYYHLKANSMPFNIQNGRTVNIGQLIAQSSTTGISTGPHLHLGLKNKNGQLLDALEYIDFNYTK